MIFFAETEKYRKEKNGRFKKKEGIQFFRVKRGKKVFPRKTLEVRLSDRADIGEGE